MDIQLGRLERVDLRTAWQTEDGDFTNWLAQEENLALLAETLGLELECEGTEQGVGPFRADILCKDTLTDAWVLIENQLERTDHGHLGQLLTYAAGLEAVTIVWIASRFTDEHRAALDWLNEITDERFNFFGLEIELWKIGQSLAAPKFNVISKPNSWSKAVGGTSRGMVNQNGQSYLDYWTAFQAHMQEHPGEVRPKEPGTRYWLNFSVGKGGFLVRTWASRRDSRMGVCLAIRDRVYAKSFFQQLKGMKNDIENEIGEELDWRFLPNNLESQVAIMRTGVDINNPDEWPEQHQWMAERLYGFHRAFSGRIQTLAEVPYDEGSTDGFQEDDVIELIEDPNA
ncbi:MAG: DUF4268 domain-containing protein [Armatimonadia bacterium]